MDITGFEKIAPHLANPLVLIGFVLLLAYGIHWQLMKSGLLSKVDKKDSSLIIRLFLRYGFWLALAMLVAGFLLQFSGIGLSAWNSYMEKEKVQTVNARQVAEKLLTPLQGQLAAKDEQIKALTEAITALSKTGAPAASINDALQVLEQGNTAKAQAIFAEVLRSKEAEGKQANKEAAAAARHLGALAFKGDTKEALAAYQKAVQLDPDNADGWTWLGHLLLRTGELTQAEEAYRKVLALGEAHQDKEEQAAALGNLGLVYATRGELAQAEEMYRKSLALDEALGNKEGIAQEYGNLALVYATRDELSKAEEILKEALVLHEALGSKEGMAADYSNLGNVYQTRDDLVQAEKMYRKALSLHESLGSKEGMAQNYGNIGNMYFTRGDLAQAEEMHKKALAFNEVLGRKRGMAINYGNMGDVYKKRGDLDQAEALYKKSLRLYQEIKHPDAKEVQQWLDELAQQRVSQQAPPAASPRR